MSTFALLAIPLFAMLVLGAALLLFRGRTTPDEKWDGYLDNDIDGLQKLLGPAAREISGTKAVQRLKADPIEGLQRKLRIGNAFFGDVEVFFAYQIAAFFAAALILALTFLPGLPGLFRIVFALLAVIIVVWPYSTVSKQAKERAQAITAELPDFAELTLMVLPSMSVPQSLSFTAGRLDGPVAFEMRELVKTLSMRTMSEDEAFDLTADRLGTVEARQFVASLKTAYVDGTKSVDVIRSQVDNLRKIQFQDARAKAKRLPISMVVAFAIHFMPLLFILVFIPVAASLSGVG